MPGILMPDQGGMGCDVVNNDAKASWVALNRVRGLAPVLVARLLEEFGDPQGIALAPRSALEKVKGVGPRALEGLEALRRPESIEGARAEIVRAGRLGAAVLTRTDQGYPPRLLEGVPDPPPALYVRGSILPADERAIAIVGSRQATPYGLEVARRLAEDLAANGYTVVSGLARGIDAAAHRGALASGGRTLAVLGCGIDVSYPPGHHTLVREVAARGAVLSEFPLGTQPFAPNFPVRNRLISGLSLTVVVVEADEKSGSLITARLAAEQGRNVGAVPGPITWPRSAGANLLIQDGARLVRHWLDVVEDLPERYRPVAAPGSEAGETLGEHARRILAALSPAAPRHVDVLAGELEESAGDLLADLLDLELRRLVVSLPGKHFLRRA
jgi:DNA processing protein